MKLSVCIFLFTISSTPISRNLMKSEFLSVYHFFNAQQGFVMLPKVDEHIGWSIDDDQQRWYVVWELWKWQLDNRIFWHYFPKLAHNHCSIKMIVIVINWWIKIEQLEAMRGVQSGWFYDLIVILTNCEDYPHHGAYQQPEAKRGTAVQAGSTPRGLGPIWHCGTPHRLRIKNHNVILVSDERCEAKRVPYKRISGDDT